MASASSDRKAETGKFVARIQKLTTEERKRLADLADGRPTRRQLDRIANPKTAPSVMQQDTIDALKRAFERFDRDTESHPSRRTRKALGKELHDDGLLRSMILGHIIQRRPPDFIARKLRLDHRFEVSPQKIRQVVWDAIFDGLLQHAPKPDEQLGAKIRKNYELKEVRVINTVSPDDIAREGAKMLKDILNTMDSAKLGDPPTARIGFWGGNTPGILVKHFAEDLKLDAPSKLHKIVFHSLLGILAGKDPWIDPNSFFNPFQDSPMNMEFQYLPVPGIVAKEEKTLLEDFTLFQAAKERAQDLHVVVSSAGHFRCGVAAQSFIQNAIEGTRLDAKWKTTQRRLGRAGCAGDVMWHWVNEKGEMKIETDVQLVTALSLEQVHALIKEKSAAALLMIGPCSECDESKSKLLRIALEKLPRCVTHLVCDSRSASKFLQGKDD